MKVNATGLTSLPSDPSQVTPVTALLAYIPGINREELQRSVCQVTPVEVTALLAYIPGINREELQRATDAREKGKGRVI